MSLRLFQRYLALGNATAFARKETCGARKTEYATLLPLRESAQVASLDTMDFPAKPATADC
jgi:hypothetical protein